MRRRAATDESKAYDRSARRPIKNAGSGGWEERGRGGAAHCVLIGAKKRRAGPGARAGSFTVVSAARRSSLFTTHVASAPYGTATVLRRARRESM